MKKFLFIFFILVGLTISNSLSAQSGGRKKEKKSKSRGSFVLKKSKSKGHADEFARGNSGRRSWLSRLFTKNRPSWVYKRSGTRYNQHKANKYLFKRERPEGVTDNDETQRKQNKKRARKRERGSFHKRKH